MLVNKPKLKIAVTELLIAAVSIIFLIGIRVWFPVCEPSGESYMSCHWAGESLGAVSIVIAVLSVVHIFIPDAKIKTGMDIAALGTAVYTFLIPGTIISLCKMPEMSCRSNTALWTTVIMIVFAVITAADIILQLSCNSGEKHRRKKTEGQI